MFYYNFGTISGTLSGSKINENGATLIRTGLLGADSAPDVLLAIPRKGTKKGAIWEPIGIPLAP